MELAKATRRRRLTAAATALAALLPLSDCSGYRKTYSVGVSLPLSGSEAPDGQSMLAAIRFAADEANRTGAAGDGRIELVVKDDKNDPAVARQVAEELTRDSHVLAVVGPYYASTLMGGAKDIYERNRVLMLSPYECNSDPRASGQWQFDINNADDIAAGYMAAYAKEVLQLDNLLVIHNTDPFGEASKTAFLQKAERLGLKVRKVVYYDHVKKFGDDFIDRNVTPDDIAHIGAVVIFSHQESGLKLIKQLRKAGVQAPVLGPHTFSGRKFLSELDEKESRNVIVFSPFLFEMASEKATDFRARLTAKTGMQPATADPLAADAVFLLAEAFKNKQSDRDGLRAYLSSLTWQTAFDGLTGSLFFNKDHQMQRDIFVSQIKDGRFKAAFKQMSVPREPYVAEQLAERVEKGYLRVIDGVPYHWIDVVFVGMDFIKVNDVDPRTMMFEAELFVWYKWVNEKIDVGQFDFLNLMQRKDQFILKETLATPIKYRAYRVKATFYMPFDLKAFPFDSQYLPVYIAHRNKNSTHVMLVPDARHLDEAPVSNITPQEWSFDHKSMDTVLYRYGSTFGDPDYRLGTGYKSKIYFSTVNAHVVVKRKLLPYMFNLFLPLAIIIAISLLIFRIPVDQFVLRINSSMTALMAILLYYLAQKSALPRVGYLMKADYYFILAFAFMLVLQSINIYIVHRQQSDGKKEGAQRLNRVFSRWFVAITVLAYAVITLLV